MWPFHYLTVSFSPSRTSNLAHPSPSSFLLIQVLPILYPFPPLHITHKLHFAIDSHSPSFNYFTMSPSSFTPLSRVLDWQITLPVEALDVSLFVPWKVNAYIVALPAGRALVLLFRRPFSGLRHSIWVHLCMKKSCMCQASYSINWHPCHQSCSHFWRANRGILFDQPSKRLLLHSPGEQYQC